MNHVRTTEQSNTKSETKEQPNAHFHIHGQPIRLSGISGYSNNPGAPTPQSINKFAKAVNNLKIR